MLREQAGLSQEQLAAKLGLCSRVLCLLGKTPGSHSALTNYSAWLRL